MEPDIVKKIVKLIIYSFFMKKGGILGIINN